MIAQITDARTARLAAAYEVLTPDSQRALVDLYEGDAHFIDPFNDVRGRQAIGAIFTHMFEVLQAPRFTVRAACTEGDVAFLVWDLRFHRNGKAMTIHGVTHVEFGLDGRVRLHRDYWDPVAEILAKMPLLGHVTSLLRKRFSPSSSPA